jgi:hypothetical protein
MRRSNARVRSEVVTHPDGWCRRASNGASFRALARPANARVCSHLRTPEFRRLERRDLSRMAFPA